MIRRLSVRTIASSKASLLAGLWVIGALLALQLNESRAFTLQQPLHPRGQRASTRPLLSSSSDDSDNDDFMKDLQNRMEQVSDRESKLPIVVLDSMLPRQVLKIKVDNKVFIDLVRSLVEEENLYFGMVGTAQLTTGQNMPLQNGVQVEIVGSPVMKEGGLCIELRAGRRIRIAGELDNTDEGWGEARVRFLDSKEEDKQEDPLILSRAVTLAREFTSPNMNVPDGKSLVERWIELARENERHKDQVDDLLRDLGPMPAVHKATELAMWVGALINPLPGMGVAMEIRPSLLMASTSEERVKVALQGLLASIRHMDGSVRLF